MLMSKRHDARQPKTRAFAVLASVLGLAVVPAHDASAHPHIFVDGGVDFVMGPQNMLQRLNVTWRYDPFETLYILSAYSLQPNAEGELDEEDSLYLAQERSAWPDDFQGASHVSADGAPVQLKRPTGFEARLNQGRLEISFARDLETPVSLSESEVSVAVYESTYYYAFSVTDAPAFIGGATCQADVIPFSPDGQDASMLAMLATLGREEVPEVENVGADFADRIALTCG
jgi:ABC-type uncharacterized transport system substrate-binding protein